MSEEVEVEEEAEVERMFRDLYSPVEVRTVPPLSIGMGSVDVIASCVCMFLQRPREAGVKRGGDQKERRDGDVNQYFL